MPARRIAVVAVALLSLNAAAAGAVPGPAGTLRVRACLTAAATTGCTTAALADATGGSSAISPDGATVYTTGTDGSTNGVLVAWARNRATGALTLRNCASYDLGSCIGSAGLFQPNQLAVGPHAVYVVGNQGLAVEEFPTAADGSLGAPASCIGAGCDAPLAHTAPGLTGLRSVAITPDGRTLAVVANGTSSGGLSVFSVDPATGTIGGRLTCLAADTPQPPACVTTPGLAGVNTVTATNRAFYASTNDGTYAGIYEFDRDAISGSVVDTVDSCVQEALKTIPSVTCLQGRGIPDLFRLTTSPDAHSLYGVDPETDTKGYVTTFSLDATTGHLTGEQSCFGGAGDPNCPSESGLLSPQAVVVSPDGHQIYSVSTSASGGAVTTFTRDPSSGSPQIPDISCITSLASLCPGSALGAATPSLATPAAVVVDPVDGRDVIASGGGLTTLSREVAPTCAATSASTTVGVPVTLTPACTDANGDPLTFSVAAAPLDGLAQPVAGGITYTPHAGFLGADALSFTASDGSLSSSAAQATLTVGPTPIVTSMPTTTATTPPPTPKPPPPAAPVKLTITAPRKKTTTIKGTASDPHTIKSITVGITMKLKHGRCHQLIAVRGAHSTGRLSPSPSNMCGARYTVVAEGTKSWSIKLTSPLAAGSYTISVRLKDTTAHATTAHRTVVIR